jgi:Uncharacterised nucleotidyltransferase
MAFRARRHRVDRLLGGRSADDDRVDALFDELSTRELRRVVDVLEAAGLAPLVFKGTALAHTHYPHPWMRPRLDTDILIAPESRARAFEILRQQGYQEPPVASGGLVSYQAMFVRPAELDVEHVIDLHWRIANPQVVANTMQHAELVARADRVAFAGGGCLRVPSAVDALLIACLHRAAHHADADDVIWIYDIHLIATRLDSRQWSAFADDAISRKIAAISARGLTLAIARFDTAVPEDVMRRLSTTLVDCMGHFWSGRSVVATADTRANPGSPARVCCALGWSQRAACSRNRWYMPLEPSAIFLRRDLRPVDRLAADLAALAPRQRARLLREHLFPPASYMRGKYGVRSRALLPAFYAYRIVAGASKWLRRPDEESGIGNQESDSVQPRGIR